MVVSSVNHFYLAGFFYCFKSGIDAADGELARLKHSILR
jgi:phosphatidylglycerophosphate synthase